MLSYAYVFLILFYGIVKGFREALKKKCTEKNSVCVVLFFYSLISFLFLIPVSLGASALTGQALSFASLLKVNFVQHLFIFLKTFVIFVAWICALNSIKKLPLSIYGVVDTARVVIALLLGVLLLGNIPTGLQIVGMALVLTGITLVNLKAKHSPEIQKPNPKIYGLVLISCLGNATSAIMDKWLLAPAETTQNYLIPRSVLGETVLTDWQVQFWYMVYMTVLYGLYLLIRREKFSLKTVLKDPYIWILSFLFIVADKCLFIANAMPSQFVVMEIIKQSSVLVTIFMGKVFYKEKQIGYRIFCAVLIIVGILISSI